MVEDWEGDELGAALAYMSVRPLEWDSESPEEWDDDRRDWGRDAWELEARAELEAQWARVAELGQPLGPLYEELRAMIEASPVLKSDWERVRELEFFVRLSLAEQRAEAERAAAAGAAETATADATADADEEIPY